LCQKGYITVRGKWSYPNAKAPDHCKRKPRRADIKIADELFTSHLKDRTPGGSIQGINAPRKKIVIGVVFHINLQ
jgi:cell shape-determining protein MreC